MARAKRRRARTIAEGLIGKDTFLVLDPSGNTVATKGYKPLALTRAQMLAMQAPPGSTFTVKREDILGPPVVLYRVERTEEAAVTYVVSRED